MRYEIDVRLFGKMATLTWQDGEVSGDPVFVDVLKVAEEGAEGRALGLEPLGPYADRAHLSQAGPALALMRTVFEVLDVSGEVPQGGEGFLAMPQDDAGKRALAEILDMRSAYADRELPLAMTERWEALGESLPFVGPHVIECNWSVDGPDMEDTDGRGQALPGGSDRQGERGPGRGGLYPADPGHDAGHGGRVQPDQDREGRGAGERGGDRGWDRAGHSRVQARGAGPLGPDAPSAFHLAGRHDQKLHGRRGPGFEQVRFTGALTVRKINSNFQETNLPLEGERAIFGRALNRKDWQRLSGAPDGSEVEVRAYRSWYGEHALTIRVNHPALEHAHLRIKREQSPDDDWDATPTFRNIIDDVSLFIRPEAQPKGYGIQAASVMLHAARDLGIDKVKINGARGDGTTGYYTWPKLGFNSEEVTWDHRGAPSEIRVARDLLELYATPGGRKWWKEHGDSTDMEFDTTPHSRSWRTFDAYMRSTGLDGRVAWAESLRFHLAGRHDQKKHGRRGPAMERVTYTGDVDLTFRTREPTAHDPNVARMIDGRNTAKERHVFGRTLSKQEWQRLTGAPDGSKLVVSYEGYDEFSASVKHAGMTQNAWMYFAKSLSYPNRPYIRDVSLFLPRNMQREAYGLQATRVMFTQARELGLSHVAIEGVGSRNPRGHSTGYFTWPKLGFDAPIPYGLRNYAPHGARTLLDLYTTHEGRVFWKRFGTDTEMAFDLDAGSRSWQAFNGYLAGSRAGRSLED